MHGGFSFFLSLQIRLCFYNDEQMLYVKNKDIRKWIIVYNTLNKSDIIN